MQLDRITGGQVIDSPLDSIDASPRNYHSNQPFLLSYLTSPAVRPIDTLAMPWEHRCNICRRSSVSCHCRGRHRGSGLGVVLYWIEMWCCFRGSLDVVPGPCGRGGGWSSWSQRKNATCGFIAVLAWCLVTRVPFDS